MKVNKNLVMMTAVGLMLGFSSCNVNEDIQDATSEPVRFSAGISNQAVQNASPGTRAAGTDWAVNDKVGIFMVDNAASTTVVESNKQYNISNATTGAMTAESGEEIYYPMDGSAVNFIAYYPWKTGNTLGTAIDVEIATAQSETNQPGFDLLYATADNNGNGYSKATTGSVNLTFDHMLSKLVMNCVAGEGLDDTDLESMTVTINGMNTTNTFDLSDGSLGNPVTPANITPRTITDGSAYDAIIMPGSYADGDVKVVFTVNSEPYIWTLTATDAAFASGNEYTYTVTLTKTGVKVTGEINPWITGGANDRGPVTAE